LYDVTIKAWSLVCVGYVYLASAKFFKGEIVFPSILPRKLNAFTTLNTPPYKNYIYSFIQNSNICSTNHQMVGFTGFLDYALCKDKQHLKCFHPPLPRQ